MPIVNVDVDKINNTMVPITNTALNQLNAAITAASKVYYPSGEFGWSKIVGTMKDCYNDVRTYNNWIQNLSSSMTNTIVNGTETIEKIEIASVQERN